MNDVPVGSASRLIHLLGYIASGPAQFSLSDLARRADLPVSSVHRLLQELVRSGLVERARGQAYRPGRGLYLLASQVLSRFDLVHAARPLLEDLAARWNETAALCAFVPTALNAVVVDVVHAPHPLRFAVDRGVTVSLPWGSMGRAILAHLSAGEIEAAFRRYNESPIQRAPRSPRTVIVPDLAEIRATGFARHYDADQDIAGVASAVIAGDGLVLGCLGVAMPAARYRLHGDDLALAVREAARRLGSSATQALV